jgi:exopolysaccharide production protein ExoZ
VQKIRIIQALRAVAANLVVIFHIVLLYSQYDPSYAPRAANFPDIGSVGVQCFFVISGFVIATVARRESVGEFLFARFARIYPIYWFYLAVTVGYLALRHVETDGPPVISSILLLPDAAKPRLSVSWSLIHEVYFYIVVALIMAARAPLFPALGCWAAAILIFKSSGAIADSPLMALITHGYTLEFIAGAFVTLLPFRKWNPTVPSWLQRLGDASYSTYLSHLLVLAPLCRGYASVPHIGWLGDLLFIVVSVAAANVWGLLSYRFIELPIMMTSRRLGAQVGQGLAPLTDSHIR